MTTFSFNLLSREPGIIENVSPPPRLRIPLSCHTPAVDVGMEIRAGEKVGKAVKPTAGDMHSPLPGKVMDVQPESILIETTSGDTIAPADAASIPDGDLVPFLREMGICTSPLTRATTLIINAVPSEPGVAVYSALLRDYRKILELGLETVKKIVSPTRIVMAAVRGGKINAFGGCSVTHLAPVYPNGLAPMVIKAITGQEVRLGEQAEETVLLTVLDLYRIGKIMDTGLPNTDTVMTLGNKSLRVPVGMPVRFLLDLAGHTIQHGDRVVLDGLLHGLTVANIEQGVHREATSLHVLRQDAFPPVEDRFCVGCGECAAHCPARIMPNMISRAAEFKLFERAEEYYVNACIECGICGYYCKARRPLLHYIRFAKEELALLKEECETEVTGEA